MLNLNDCIRKLNPLQLKYITERYGLVLIPFSSHAAREALVSALTVDGFAGQCIANYSLSEKTALTVVVLLADYAPAEAINSIVENTADNREQAQETLRFILGSGLVYLAQIEPDNINRYIIPDELRKCLMSFVSEQFLSTAGRYEQAVSQEFHEHMSFELSVLAVLMDTIKNDVRLNTDNTLGKRAVNRLMPYLGLPPDSVDEKTVDKYANTIFGYLLELALISKEHHVQVRAVDQWLDLSAGKRRELFFDFLMEGKHTPLNFQYFVHLLSLIPAGNLYDISILFSLTRTVFGYNDVSFDEFCDHPFSCYPVLLLYLTGIITFAAENIHRFCAWRTTPFGKTLMSGGSQSEIVHQIDNHIIIQPNFEFMISRNADLKLLWQVYRFADLVQCEQLLRFHISRDSIYRGMACSVMRDEIVAVLERNAKGSVSQNVIYSVREWCEEYGAVYFMDVFLLRCKTKHIADHIKVHPRTKDYVKGSLSDTDLIVRKSDLEELIGLLKTLGFMPIEHVIRPEDEPAQPPGMAKLRRGRKFRERSAVVFDYNSVKILADISDLT